jgi:hypothetical protein
MIFAKKLNPFGVHVGTWQRSRCLNLFEAIAIFIDQYYYQSLVSKAYLHLTTWSFSRVIILTFFSLILSSWRGRFSFSHYCPQFSILMQLNGGW